jgi:hypothetical protein
MRTTPKLVAPAALAAALLALSACTTPTPKPTAAPPTSAGPATPSSSPSAPTGDTLGPLGYGALKLGATKAEAKASGLTEGIVGTKGECGGAPDGHLIGAPLEPDGDYARGNLVFSVTTGKLVYIDGLDNMATPEGIKVGNTLAELKAAFPKLAEDFDTDGSGFNTEVPSNPKAYYDFTVVDGKVLSLALIASDQDCFD